MTKFKRYAIYYAPEPGPLATFGAAWLGWDAGAGVPLAPPELPDLPLPVAEITATPRKYGFHGTLKPPFRLADGYSRAALEHEVSALARRLSPVTLDGLTLARLGHFVALTPRGRTTRLASLAAHVVMELDRFRAPQSAAELARRRPATLNQTQCALLKRWGHPYVMEEFRFHLTLTGHLPGPKVRAIEATLAPVLAPLLPERFTLAELCLFGEARDGMFHLLRRYALSG